MAAYQQLLGTSTLLQGAKSVSVAEALGSKSFVGFYFSAHWCPPCRQFTPKLAEFYKAHHVSKNFEIVFLSSDRDEASFNEYYHDMPWLAVPFSEGQVKNTLSKKYKVQGIPTLVIVGKDGQTITADARGKVMTDPTASKFPWAPPSMLDLLGNTKLINNKNEPFNFNLLKAKDAIGIYFSAQWCGPCRAFTPKLVQAYEKFKDQFQVIFVSADHSAEKFEDYFGHMPWLAVPFEEEEARMELNEFFGIEGFPTLIIVDPKTGKVINNEGRSAIASDDKLEHFPWRVPAYQALSGNRLNTDPCFAVLYGGPVDQNLNLELKSMAERFYNKFEVAGLTSHPVYFYYGDGSAVEQQVRKVLKLGENKPMMVVISIPDQAKYVYPSQNFTVADAEQFVQAFIDGSLNPSPLSN